MEHHDVVAECGRFSLLERSNRDEAGVPLANMRFTPISGMPSYIHKYLCHIEILKTKRQNIILTFRLFVSLHADKQQQWISYGNGKHRTSERQPGRQFLVTEHGCVPSKSATDEFASGNAAVATRGKIDADNTKRRES